MPPKLSSQGRGRGRGRSNGRGNGGRSGRGGGGGRGGKQKAKNGGPITACGNCHTSNETHGVQVYDSDRFIRGSGSGPLKLKICPHCRKVAFCCKGCEHNHMCWKKKKEKQEKAAKKAMQVDLAQAPVSQEENGMTFHQQYERNSVLLPTEPAPVDNNAIVRELLAAEEYEALSHFLGLLGVNYSAEQLRDAYGRSTENGNTDYHAMQEESANSKNCEDSLAARGSHDVKDSGSDGDDYDDGNGHEDIQAVNMMEPKPAPPVEKAPSQATAKSPSKRKADGNLAGAFAKPAQTDKKTARPKAKAYGNLAGAFATPKRKPATGVQRPKALPKPTTSGRTSLGQERPSLKVLGTLLMRDDIVLHVDPRTCPEEPGLLHEFTGVYETEYLDEDGCPSFALSVRKTEMLCQRFMECSPQARHCLANVRGIYIESRQRAIGTQLGRFHTGHPNLWTAIDFEDRHRAHLTGPGLMRDREMEFWTRDTSLFQPHTEPFVPWRGKSGLEFFVAMTPLTAFHRALELAEMPQGSPLPPLKAPDFSFWNKPLVVHADVQKCSGMMESLSAWMGAYVPQGRTFEGYPVWQQSRKRSNALAASVSKASLGESLEALGIALHHSDSEASVFLYMHRHALHIASKEGFDSNPSHKFSLRGNSTPSSEARLLTQADALFQVGREAFANWTFYVDNKWQDVSLAVTPEDFFKKTIDLVDIERGFGEEDNSEEFQPTNAGKKKKKKKKKKHKPKQDTSADKIDPVRVAKSPGNDEGGGPRDVAESSAVDQGSKAQENDDVEQEAAEVNANETEGPDTSGVQARTKLAQHQSDRLVKDVGLAPREAKEPTSAGASEQLTTTSKLLRDFFNVEVNDPSFLLVDEKVASSIYAASLQADSSVVFESTKDWLRSCADALLTICIARGWKHFVVTLLRSGVTISATNLKNAFEKLPCDRNDDYNNLIAKGVTKIELLSSDDFSPLFAAVSKRVGKNAKRDFFSVLKSADTELKASQRKKGDPQQKLQAGEVESVGGTNMIISAPKEVDEERKIESEEISTGKNTAIERLQNRIELSLRWYKKQLSHFQTSTRADIEGAVESVAETYQEESPENVYSEEEREKSLLVQDAKRTLLLSSKDVAAEMTKCVHLPEKQQEEKICDIERSIDLTDFEDSEWTVEMTEHAHKWFRKHLKRERYLCDRVIRRLKILSTGRWSYVLCKPVRTSKSSVNLYESKIDKACRILWEVAVAFSPRRSKDSHSFCEQVIRVWDIVLDHDNLTRSIEAAVSRIEKSNLRGQECMIYSELEDFDNRTGVISAPDFVVGQQVPRVFAMREGLEVRNEVPAIESESCRHYPPASDDPRQYTLLKFYELDAGAIQLLLDGENENHDLPFTPGPKEHEIIHYSSNPPRSILLMGRSGTGKTTCLVFRMWAKYMRYETSGLKPQLLFVTKNDVLRQEVEKSFQNMGLAWQRKNTSPETRDVCMEEPAQLPDDRSDTTTSARTINSPLFLTSNEWLEVLDAELPGERFFTPSEVEERIDCRNEDDVVRRGVEALFAEDEKLGGSNSKKETTRQEFTFSVFRNKWSKINSRTKSNLDPALVWREIKSYIKGSVSALHIDDPDRSLSQKRFLSLDEYLALPRKVSRLDQAQRRVAYELYERYEKIKTEGNQFDEMDVVYNLAGRVSLFYNSDERAEDSEDKSHQGFIPIDSLFVDEVQDFTQAELYLLVKLSRDPNNLMLAGDTAQSISIGVGFRFADVRQIFFKEFGGNEPQLLQLIYNYRSHSGVLRLAACVVELLYFFFSDSLDRLPPDLGLFSGPKPVIMEAQSPDELVLMLEGSKRETSRIEFGAHQVVIVRSEEAKQQLPDEFGVDKDWVMTVQEAKGLEFDDVLLYDFFTDSQAGDLWRVASNYTSKDCADYFDHVSVKASGVKSYNWDDLLETKSRNLDFSSEQHKILETELKMLYTAITRARVNVFIAESDAELSRPMFEYFKKRQLVEVSNSNDSGDMSGVRVFGKMSSVDDYRQRGEYYLQNAEGSRRKGCLRLAAKCFEKAGEMKRRDFALAYLSFVEVDEQEIPTGRRREKQAAARKERLYKIAVQLLEAEDIVFLDKAALCLLQTGDRELSRSAEMFELYAEISFARRGRSNDSRDGQPSKQEQQYFSYAAKFFERAASNQQISLAGRRALLMRSFRDYLCSGKTDELQSASSLLERNSHLLQKSFKELVVLLAPSEENRKDPISYFHRILKESPVAECVKVSMERLARVSCRSYYAEDDALGMMSALTSIPSAEKIHMLRSLDTEPLDFLLAAPWASHSIFSKQRGGAEKTARAAKRIDVTSMLVEVYTSSQQEEKAAEILEERGLLLDASERLQRLARADTNESSQHKSLSKSAELKVRYVDLVLRCRHWEKRRSELHEILNQALHEVDSLPESVSMSAALADVKLTGGDPWEALHDCETSVLWKYDGIMMIFSRPSGIHELLSKRPGADYWGNVLFVVQTIQELGRTAAILHTFGSSRKPEAVSLVAQVESYFELKQHQFDPSQLVTGSVTNLRLRIALFQNENLLESSLTRNLLLQLDRETVHGALAKDLYRKASQLLLTLEKHLSEEATKTRPCASIRFGSKCRYRKPCKSSHIFLLQACRDNANILQCQLLCIEQMRLLRREVDLKFPGWSAGKSLTERCKERQHHAANDLVDYLLNTTSVRFKVVEDEYTEDRSVSSSIVWRESTLHALAQNEHQRWRNLPLYWKKENVMECVRSWRTLHFCDEKANASQKMEKKLQWIERNKSMIKKDLAKNKTDHFIDSTADEKDLKLVSNMWIWAVDAVNDDLFQSVSTTEKILTRTTTLAGLGTFSKMDQISLLEANAIGIFSALSLRYSEVSKPAQHCYWLIPKQGYLSCYLDGDVSCRARGFGLPLKDVVLGACDKNFFQFFAKFICHLENLADTIVKNELLRRPKENQIEDLGRFERAICLSFFICTNSLLFSLSGSNINSHEAESELNDLPAVPLSGNICSLVKKMRSAVVGCTASPRLQNAYNSLNETSTFLDLMQSTNALLQKSGWSDKLILCRLQKVKRGKVEVDTSEDTSRVESVLRNVAFDESRGAFVKDYKPKCQDFLLYYEQSTEALDNSNDLSAVSRKSLERSAAMTISRYLRNWQKEANASKDRAAAASQHFRAWKILLVRFVNRVKRRMEQVLEERGAPLDSDLPEIPFMAFCPLNGIPNHFNDVGNFQRSFNKWSEQLTSRFSPFCDGIECTYCGIPGDPHAQFDRNQWWQANYPILTYNEAATNYNWAHFNSPEAPFQYGGYGVITFSQHIYDGFHQQNVKTHQSQHESLTHLAVQMDNAFKIVQDIISVCDKQQGHPFATSWYLMVSEEARSFQSALERAQHQLFSQATSWPPRPDSFPMLLASLNTTVQQSQEFFERVRGNERRKAQEAAKRDSENQDGEAVEAPTVELVNYGK